MSSLSILLCALTTGATIGFLVSVRHEITTAIVAFFFGTGLLWLLMRTGERIRIKSAEKLAKTYPRPPPEQSLRRFQIVALITILFVPIIGIGIVSINNSVDRTIIMPIVLIEIIVMISLWGAYLRLRRTKAGDQPTVLLQRPRSFSPLFVVIVMPLVMLVFLVGSHFFGMTAGGVAGLAIYILYRGYVDLWKKS